MWPAWLTDLVVKQWGFAVPLIYAAATYGFFHYLDRKASGKAKTAISGWLKPIPITTSAVAVAILELFTRVYGQHLLSTRVFLRSAAFSVIVTLLFVLGFVLNNVTDINVVAVRSNKLLIFYILLAGLFTNIVSDYISLFFLRRWLSRATTRPLLLLSVAPIVGTLAVIMVLSIGAGLAVAATAASIMIAEGFGLGVALEAFYMALWGSPSRILDLWVTPASATRLFFPPALLVHGWLVLFALAVVFIKAVSWLLTLASWTSWFLKQGQHHPLDAIGYVAALIVFVVGVILQVMSR